jgi:hypothetical protein
MPVCFLRLPIKDSLTDKGKRHKLKDKAEITNAGSSCGLGRSSDEVSVMEMERRA